MAEIRSHRRGFTLVAMAVAAVALFGIAGLAVDVGRMYITKNEAQTFADAAAIAAAMQLDGTAGGLTKADTAAAGQGNTWNFATTAFAGTVVEYSANGSSGWATSGTAAPATTQYVRVIATVNNLPLILLPVTGTGNFATVKAAAVAGQVPYGTAANPVRNGVFPYSPIANIDTTTVVAAGGGSDPFGYVRGQQYDLKWPHNASTGTLGANKVPCQGDNTTAMINRSSGGDEWGEIVLGSASALATQILDDAGGTGVSVVLGESVNPTPGQKNAVVDAFIDRAAQDTNDTTTCAYNATPAACAANLNSYLAGVHNGRRLITVIVNNGSANAAGTSYSPTLQSLGIGFATFWLLTDYDKNGGSNNPWCAVYVGPSGAPGTSNGGSGSAGGAALTYIRLIQ